MVFYTSTIVTYGILHIFHMMSVPHYTVQAMQTELYFCQIWVIAI